MLRIIARSILVVIVCTGPAALAVDSSKQLFDDLFAAKVREALATKTRADDAALATEILKAAKETRGGPVEVTVYFGEQAYEMGKRDPRGFRAAVDALAMLASLQPRRTLELQERMLELYYIAFRSSKGTSGTADKRYRRAGVATADLMAEIAEAKAEFGQTREAMVLYQRAATIAQQVESPQRDAIKAGMERVRTQALVSQKVQQYAAKLEAAPTDKASATALVDLYVISLDDPGAALPWAKLGKSAQDATMIERAAEELGQSPAKTEVELGNWYRNLAAAQQGEDQKRMLIRARMYYSFVLSGAHDTTDADRQIARLAKLAVDQELKKLDIGAKEADRLTDVRQRFVGVYTPPAEVAVAPAPTIKPEVKPAQPVKPEPKPTIVARPESKPEPTAQDPKPAPDAFLPPKRTMESTKQDRYSVPGDYWEGRKSIFDFGND